MFYRAKMDRQMDRYGVRNTRLSSCREFGQLKIGWVLSKMYCCWSPQMVVLLVCALLVHRGIIFFLMMMIYIQFRAWACACSKNSPAFVAEVYVPLWSIYRMPGTWYDVHSEWCSYTAKNFPSF